jgi:hypothetical protein
VSLSFATGSGEEPSHFIQHGVWTLRVGSVKGSWDHDEAAAGEERTEGVADVRRDHRIQRAPY